jgi:hypothetical protein
MTPVRALDIPEAGILVRRIMWDSSSIRSNSMEGGCRSSNMVVEFRSNSSNNMVVVYRLIMGRQRKRLH